MNEEAVAVSVCPVCGTELFPSDKAFFAFEKMVGCYFCTREIPVREEPKEQEEPDLGDAIDDAWAHRNDLVNDAFSDTPYDIYT